MASTVPAAIDGLLTLLAAQSVLAAPVQMVDGPFVSDVPVDYVAVGVSLDDGTPAVSGQQDWAATGAGRRRENYDITCTLSSWSGAGSMKARRDRAFAMFAGCEAAVRSDPTLGAAVIQAALGDTFAVTQGQLEGPVCTIDFSVHVQITRM